MMDQVNMYMMMLENRHLNKYGNSSSVHHTYNQANLQLDHSQVVKANKLKICKCCGDVAKSNHFGALCCCSCKAFFRRSVQNESYKNFHCPYNSNCDITILSRKCCQFCRFEKCVRIGMEKSWVMSEEERLQLLKSRMLKKQKKEQEVLQMIKTSNSNSKDSLADDSSQNSDGCYIKESTEIHSPNYDLIHNYLSDSEINQIESLVNDYLISCVQIKPKFLSGQNVFAGRMVESSEEIIQLFLNSVYQIANFAKKLHFFNTLNLTDQQMLLRNSIIELCFLRSAFCFDNSGLFYRTILIRTDVQSIDDRNFSNSILRGDQSDQNSLNDIQYDDQGVNQINNVRLSFKNTNQRDQCAQSIEHEFKFKKMPVLRKESLEQFLDEHLSSKFFSFIKQIQECNLDEPMVILMAIVILLNPERIQLINSKSITTEQEFHLNLLERYMQWRFGSTLSGTLFAKLLMTLPNLREVADLSLIFFAELQLENNVLDKFGFDDQFSEDCFEQTNCCRPIFTIKKSMDY